MVVAQQVGGSRVGPLLASSIVVGFDPGTRSMPDAQVAELPRTVLVQADFLAYVGG